MYSVWQRCQAGRPAELCPINYFTQGYVQVVSGSFDGTLRVWHPGDGACLHELKRHTADVVCISILADGRVVSGSVDCTLCVWDPDTGACKHEMIVHSGDVFSAAVLPDGRVVSSSADWTLCIWG